MRRPRVSAQRLDLHALRAGIAGPGLDTRSWVEMARIDDDPDAVVWDEKLGWLCDVTIESGGLAGEGPINCTVLGAGDAGRGFYQPLHPGDRVVVDLISGDPNVDAVIIGRVHDVDDCTAPMTVNGDTIVETGATTGQVAADETHIAAFAGEDLEAEFRRVRLVGSSHIGAVSPDICLGTDDATEHAIQGDKRNQDLTALLAAMTSFCSTVSGSGLPVVATAAATLQTAVQTYQGQLASHLSQRVKVSS